MRSLQEDPLVRAVDYGFRVDPVYFHQGLSDRPDCLLRRGVAERLVRAREQLPQGLNFKIWDAYRTTATQRRLYDLLYKKLEQLNPYWTAEELHAGTREFVSPPTVDPNCAAPHNTGGTVDLTLVDKEDGEFDMGTEFDHFNEEAHTFHFEKASPGTREAKIHANRMQLYQSLTRLGFYNFPSEWWHYSYGDAHWAKATGQTILYPSCEI